MTKSRGSSCKRGGGGGGGGSSSGGGGSSGMQRGAGEAAQLEAALEAEARNTKEIVTF